MGSVVYAGRRLGPVEPEVAPAVTEKRRARHAAGSEDAKPGTFVADDPSTPDVDEAYE